MWSGSSCSLWFTSSDAKERRVTWLLQLLDRKHPRSRQARSICRCRQIDRAWRDLGCFRSRSCSSHVTLLSLASDDVNHSEHDDPDHIHEMPIQREDVHPLAVLRLHLAQKS